MAGRATRYDGGEAVRAAERLAQGAGAAPIWQAAGGLTLGVGLAALAAETTGGLDGVLLLTGAAAAGGFGVFALAERLGGARSRSGADAVQSFHALFDAAPEIAALVDRSGRIKALNPAAAQEAERRGLRPVGASDLLFEARDPQRVVFDLLGAAFSRDPQDPDEELDGRLERRIEGDKLVTASPAGDGLALWRVRAIPVRGGLRASARSNVAAARAAAAPDHYDRAFETARVAWFKVGPTGRIAASSKLFEAWTGARAGSRPSLFSLFPDLARRVDPSEDLPEHLSLPSRLIGAPGAPRAVIVCFGRVAGGSDLLGVAAPLPDEAAGAVGLDAPPPMPLGADAPEARRRLSGRLLDAFDALPAERVVSEAAIGVLVLSPEGRILRLNAAADRLMTDRVASAAEGRGAAQVIGPSGDHLIDWIAEEDREPSEARLKAAAAGGASAFEARLDAPDEEGSGRLVQCFLSGVDSAVGRLVLCHMIDVSEQRGLEQSFIQSQKLQAVGQLSGGIAHDFNNLLTVILNAADVQLKRLREDDHAYQDLYAIHQAGLRAAQLVGQLLAFSRKQTLTPKVADLTERCSEIVILLHRLLGERYEIVTDLEEALWPVEVDVNQFEQVVTNLVVNASHAMKTGGVIRLTTANAAVKEPRAQGNFAMPAGDYVRITVEDKGHGIKPTELAKIFEPFFTTKPEGKGTGLGLAMVYGVVKQSNGFVFVDSEVDVGTVFTIYLPRLSEAEARAKADGKGEGLRRAAEGVVKQRSAQERSVQELTAQPAIGGTGPSAPTDLLSAAAKLRGEPSTAGSAGAGAGVGDAAPAAMRAGPRGDAAPPSLAPYRGPAPTGTILLVEDQGMLRALAARMLAASGHKVLEAESGAEALEFLKDASQKIDLFLSDVVLEDMDGPSVLREIGAERPEMGVIFMSGYARDAFSETLDSASAHRREARFLQKPFTNDELTEAVAEALQPE